MASVLLGLGYFVGLVCSPIGLNRLVVLGLFALVAALWSLAAYYWGGSLALAASHAREVVHDEQPRLWNVVEEISIAAGVPMPKVYLIDDPAHNALATGRDPRHAGMAVTTGLLALMNRQELQGVLAHEVAHVRNYDVRFATLACGIVGVVAASGVVFLQMGLAGPRLAELLLSDACDRHHNQVGACPGAPSSWCSSRFPPSSARPRPGRPAAAPASCSSPSPVGATISPTPQP